MVQYSGPTGTRGGVWRVTSEAYYGAVVTPYRHELSQEDRILAAAEEAIRRKGLPWTLTGDIAFIAPGKYVVLAKGAD